MADFLHIALPDEEATTALGARLADIARPGDILALYGDLGMGKTALARGFVRALAGAGEEVPSPTFTLVQTYPVEAPSGDLTIWHFDLYRLQDPSEAGELGLEEALDGVALIEWPDRLGGDLPARRLDLALASPGSAGEETGRHATLIPRGGSDWLSRLIETGGFQP